MLPPGLQGHDLAARPLIIGVLELGGDVPSGDPSAAARVLLAAGADVVEVEVVASPDGSARMDPAAAETIARLRTAGLPLISTGSDLAELLPGPASTGDPFVTLPLAELAASLASRPNQLEGAAVTVLPFIAEIDPQAAADRVAVAAQVTLVAAAGVRIYRTPDPRTVRRVTHVVMAIEAAR